LSYFDSDLPFCEVDVRNEKGNTPLHLVAQRGALRECEILLDHGADPEAKNKNEETPFAFVTEEVCPEVKELFRVEINKRKNPPTLFQFCASKAQISGLISELTIPQNDIRQKAIISAKYMLNTAQNLQTEDHISQKIESLKI
jgi:ankyrin repeat protein